jgi:glycosyltransferase involved in cell wall biosynthesis
MALKNICLVTHGNFEDSNTWSGTPRILSSQLRKRGFWVWGIDVSKISILFLRIINAVYVRLGFFSIFAHRGPILYRAFYKNIPRFLTCHSQKTDAVLFIAEHYLLHEYNPDTIYALYADADPLERLPFLTFRKRNLGKSWFLEHYYNITKESLKYLNFVFTQNEWTRQALINNYRLSEDKVINVGFGINVEPYTGIKDYNSELLLILVRKGYERDKGLFELVEAFKILRSMRPNVRLAVVGTDIIENTDGITCYYNQPREVTLDLYKLSSLYVLLNICEPNGISYLEALANRTPIVGLDRFAFPEFSGYGRWGFILKNTAPEYIAHILDDALNNKQRLQQMGQEGQAYVLERFRWEKVIDRILNILK